MVVLSCKTLGEIICITRPDTSFFGLFDEHKWFAAIYPASTEKYQLEAKTTKMATPPHKIAVSLLYWDVQAEKF